MPIGVASISFTWEIPAGSTERTWEGRGVFAIAASMPGTGNTGYNGKTAFGDIYLKWFYCMDGTGRKGDGPMFKQVIFLDHRTQAFGVSRL
mgnify:CR=1 FL=1